ncbi:MAG: hypothetical protein RhofKO_41610 [Rhodothermales bacterium]
MKDQGEVYLLIHDFSVEEALAWVEQTFGKVSKRCRIDEITHGRVRELPLILTPINESILEIWYRESVEKRRLAELASEAALYLNQEVLFDPGEKYAPSVWQLVKPNGTTILIDWDDEIQPWPVT